MTALSPAEQAEVTRFGLYDTFIISDMENRADDEAQCCLLYTSDATDE